MNDEIRQIQTQIEALNLKLAEARRRAAVPQTVKDYPFRDAHGESVRLSELFAGRYDMLIIHNMGRRCSYCTMWADGFNGLRHHLEDRCALVVASPDEPAEMREFAASRGWNFRMVSTRDTSFTKDLGFEPEPGAVWPGVSSLHRREDGQIERISSAQFGPGDAYCPVWPLLDLLKDGAAAWEPKLSYP